MSKAKEIIRIMDEANGVSTQVPDNAVPVSSVDQLKPGVQVFFKVDHPKYPAMGPSLVVNLHPELDSVDLKFGKSTLVNVPVSDLMLLNSNSGNTSNASSAASASGQS